MDLFVRYKKNPFKSTLGVGKPRVEKLGVVKVGGSLFDLDDWPARLLQWLSNQQTQVSLRPASGTIADAAGSNHRVVEPWLLVAGGGPWIDTLRDWDARHSLGDEACHRWCVQLLTITADMACRRLLAAANASTTVAVRPHVVTLAELGGFLQHDGVGDGDACGADTRARVSLAVLDAGAYLDDVSQSGQRRLPRDWTVSSDSIAAHLASHLSARTLVLAKSCALPLPATTPTHAAQAGLVDRHFPWAAAGSRTIQWLDLRAASPVAIPLAADLPEMFIANGDVD
jgi:aspartokinase-like uncharacterized kinase